MRYRNEDNELLVDEQTKHEREQKLKKQDNLQELDLWQRVINKMKKMILPKVIHPA